MCRKISSKGEKLITGFGDAAFVEGLESVYSSGLHEESKRKAKNAQKKLEKYITELEMALAYAIKR